MNTWVELKPEIAPSELATLTAQFGVLDVLTILRKAFAGPLIVMSRASWKGIDEYLRGSQKELGGLLLGRVYHCTKPGDSDYPYVAWIDDFIASTDYDHSRVHIHMGTTLWDKARFSIDGGKMVVGWFHSHPNLGAFFSGTDRSTQRSFFHHPYCVGLVIDPFRHEHAMFLGRDSIKCPSAIELV